VAGLLAVLIFAGGCYHKQFFYSLYDLTEFEEEHEFFEDIPYDGQIIRIENFAGKVNIIGIDPGFVAVSPFVSIEAVKKVNNIPMEDLEIEVEFDDSEIQIITDPPSKIGKFFKPRPPFIEEKLGVVEYTIRVPKDAEIEIEQELGEINLTNFEGHIDIRQTVGQLMIENSNIKTINSEQDWGDISITNSRITRNGHLKTGLGQIYVELFSDDSIRLDAKTSLNEISLQGADDFEDVDSEQESAWPGQELKLWIGKAENQLTLRADVGDIEIVILESLMEQSF
jgi:hypothetical protein